MRLPAACVEKAFKGEAVAREVEKEVFKMERLVNRAGHERCLKG